MQKILISLCAGTALCWGTPSIAGPIDRPADADGRISGVVGLRGFPAGERMAPNGLAYKPLFVFDLDLDIRLSQEGKVYLFSNSEFWGQRAAKGITNDKQGSFDFSKREFDFTPGIAWNYTGPWELRGLAYSLNNLNRGNDKWKSSGYKDGTGFENRYYFNDRKCHVGLGYFATKELVDQAGASFKPGLFVEADLAYPVSSTRMSVYARPDCICERSGQLKLLDLDAGLEFVLCHDSHVLLDVGAEPCYDLPESKGRTVAYLGLRIPF